MRRRLALVLVVLTGGVAHADDPKPVAPPAAKAPAAKPSTPSTPESAAAEVLAAIKANDASLLISLAAKEAPDPWLVADELLVRGAPDAADAFARATLRKDVEALPKYIASRRGKAPDAVAREVFSSVSAALGSGEYARAISLLEAGTPSDDPIPSIRVAQARGIALRAMKRFAESSAVFLAAAWRATEIGWVARADSMFADAGTAAYMHADSAGAITAWQARLPVAQGRGNRVGLAATLGNIGIVHNSLGDFPRALEFQARALQIIEEIGNPAAIANALGNIGNCHKALGDHLRALEFYERGFLLMEKLGDRAGVAWILGNIGSIHDALGDYARALDFQERALRVHEQLGDRDAIARAVGNIGNVHFSLGENACALEFYRRALAIRGEIGDRAGAATTLGNIGNVHFSVGEYAQALEFQERALDLKAKLGDRAGAALTLGNIGIIHASLEDYPRALEFQSRALESMEALGDRAGIARTLVNIGNTHQALANFPRALESYGKALMLAESLGAAETVLYALWGASSTHFARGDPKSATAFARRAVERLGRLANGLAEEQGATAREQFSAVFGVGAKAARALGDAGEAAFFLESGRAATLLEALGGRDALRSFAVPEDLRHEESSARAAESVAMKRNAAVGEGAALAQMRESKLALDSAQARLGAVIERIQRQEKAVASIVYPRADALGVMQGRLGEGDALVLYGLFSDEALALVVTPKSARIVSLSKPNEIEDACDAEDWAKLHTLVVTPLALGEGVRRLLVSPMGALCSVPFCVLAPSREIVYVPSGTTYGVLLDEAGKKGDGVLALGDPDYATEEEPRSVALLRGGRKLAPLPATRDEAKAVGDVLLLGGEATVDSLKSKLASKARWHAVHLACHGLVNVERPRLSSLALSNGDFLTMLDVFRSKVPADLVVLSACETARGKIYSTEGVEGFVRAFLFAGSPRVIVSLWKVDDEATRALMTKLYALWNPKDGGPVLGAATALRQAQQFVASQEKWRDPKYWAAWQLWGLPD